MKLRYSLRSLLMMPVVFAVIWMWITWPHRTFEAFTEAIKDDRFQTANAMVDVRECSFEVSPAGAHIKSNKVAALIRIQPRGLPSFVEYTVRQDRSVVDLLKARSVYVPPYLKHGESGMPRFEFVVERGHITLYYR